MKLSANSLLALALIATLTACTVHPPGEQAERSAAIDAGRPYAPPATQRALPTLPLDASPDDLVTYALLANGQIEQRYWEWRAAIEQIPQEGTQKTGLMLSLTAIISNGATAANMTNLAAGNDAMNNLVLPGKLKTAATLALQNARAVGLRFDQSRFELRARVLAAYDDYALTAEHIRLQESDLHLLDLIQRITASRLATAGALQQDLLKIENEIESARNDLAANRAKLPMQLAAINTLLNRPADALLTPPKTLPSARPLPAEDAALLAQAAQHNPELLALAQQAAADTTAITKARQEYIPDFSASISTDLAGQAQALAGSIVLPFLRHQAIDAQIRQAEATLRATHAARRQASSDLATRVITDLATLHDAQRQVDLFENNLLPRAQRLAGATRTTYAAGQASMLDVLDAERSLITLRRLAATLKIIREKNLADLEAATALNLTTENTTINESTPPYNRTQ